MDTGGSTATYGIQGRVEDLPLPTYHSRGACPKTGAYVSATLDVTIITDIDIMSTHRRL